MKKIFLGLLCVAGLTVSTSCTDFLEETPRTELTLEQYFRTAEHAQSAVNKLYRDGITYMYHPHSVFYGKFIMYGPFMSGLYDDQDYKGQEAWIAWMQTLNHNAYNITGQMDNIMERTYRNTIARANTAIKYIPNVSGLSEDEKNTLIGEAKFFRAFSYFHLVKIFGDMPLILEPYEDLEGIYAERTPSEEIYAQIIKDCQDAIASLPDKKFTDGYRITKPVAQTVLASAYLQMSGYPLQKTENYKNAADVARAIINSGIHSLIKHEDGDQRSAYNIMRTDDDSPEYIFSREYQSSSSANNGALAQMSMPNSMISDLPKGINRSIFVNVYKPSDLVLNAFDPTDLRVQEKQYWYRNLSYVNSKDEEVNVTFNQTAVWRYYNEKALYETTEGDKDIAILRYAEVLLIAAEAIAKSENAVTEEAIRYLADVRERAFVYPGSTSGITRSDIEAQLRGLSVDRFVQEVWAERLRELVFEYRVWDDIQRTRMYPQASATNPGTVEWVPVIGATNPFGAKYEEKHLLFPLSDNEIQRNPSLTQNPGF
ncbi:MAG: RagB/SusD family nutrient uptake outer membrane protein [Tannerellaceae bacterium]|nr:RagB/SusD family nutrient uptake outer membrane protein [Tannerellaceae bacterium]